MAIKTTWEPLSVNSRVRPGEELPKYVFAFPDKRKLPLTNAEDVRSALHHFKEVVGVDEAERRHAFANIGLAAEYYGVPIERNSWRDYC